MPSWKKVITSGSDAALNSLNVTTSFTASGLNYPAADNGEESFVQTDGNGTLSLQYVKTIYEEIVNGEATNLIKGTPVYVSGSVGAASVVYRADPTNPSKMPAVYISADTIAPAASGRGIALGLIKGVDTTGYPAGTEIFLAPGGGWTSTRPTGSTIVQVLGYVTKEGSGGQGVVLNPGPATLPNLPSGSVWVGNSNSAPIAVLTSSLSVASASYAPSTPAFPYTGSAEITGSLGVTGSFSTQTFDGTNYVTATEITDFKRNINDVMGTSSIDADGRTLSDGAANPSVDWEQRTLANSSGVTYVDWQNRYLYGPGPIPTTTEVAVDWSSRQLTDNNGNIILDWQTATFTGTASFATSASWAPGGGASFPYTGSAEITGSLGVTGSFSVLNSIDSANKILIGSGPIPGSTEDSVNWDSRTLFDSNGNFSMRWGALRTMFDASQVDSINWDVRRLISTNTSRSIDWENRFLHDSAGNITVDWTSTALYDVSAKNALNWDARDAYDSAEVPAINWDARRLIDSSGVVATRWDLRSAYDTVDSQSIDWSSRLLKIDNGPGAYTVNWNSGILQDTTAKTSVDWQNRQLKNTSGNEILNWSSGVSITGSLTVSGSSTFTNIGPARFSGSFVVQGDLIPGFPPFIPDVGPYDAIKVDDINYERKLYGSPSQGASASIDFGNRELLDTTGGTALSWGGSSGTYETYLYNQQNVSEATRANLFGFNNYAGQNLGDSYFDVNVVDNDLVYLNTDGQWYQVDQTTDTSTKMLGIAKNIFSQTGSIIIEGDVVVSIAPGYPIVDNAGYGLPIYIKEGAGTTMDTTVPASGYVRIVGHCYWNSGGGGADEWIMKFRPSNDWYVI